ncbi:hypothetical protein CR513_30346, partial [Mucuna pruriens]
MRESQDVYGEVGIEGEVFSWKVALFGSTSERKGSLPCGSPNYFHEWLDIFPMLKRINENAYVLDIPQEYGGMDNPNLKTNSFQEGEFDMNQGDQEELPKDVAETTGESL